MIRRRRLISSVFVLLAVAVPCSADPAARKVTLAVFDGDGVGSRVRPLLDVLAGFEDVQVSRITVAEVTAGKLVEFDVVLHPGGSGGGQGRALGAAGREQERAFLRDGGGFVGLCAGSYLASSDYDWSLHVLDAKVLDRTHWDRGFGDVVIRISPTGCELLGESDEQSTIYYHQGPLLAPAGNPDVPDYEPLATFVTEIAENGAPRGVMPGTTAIARGTYGKGRVICFSPHPERTADWNDGLHRAILWAAERNDQSPR